MASTSSGWSLFQCDSTVGRVCTPGSLPMLMRSSLQCAGEENWVDSRTIYVGHKEPPPGAEAYIPQRYPDNRIVSSKVASLSALSFCLREAAQGTAPLSSTGAPVQLLLGCHCSPGSHSAPDCCPRARQHHSTPTGLSGCFAGPHPLHSSLVSPSRGSDLKCKA